MADDDGHDAHNACYNDGNVSCGFPSWEPMSRLMGCASVVILDNLGGARGTHKMHWMCKNYSCNQKYFRASMIVTHKCLKLNLNAKQLNIKLHWIVLMMVVRRSMLCSAQFLFYHMCWMIEFHRLYNLLLKMEYLSNLNTINMLLVWNLIAKVTKNWKEWLKNAMALIT